MMEEALIRLARVYGVSAGRIAGLTGSGAAFAEPAELCAECAATRRRRGARSAPSASTFRAASPRMDLPSTSPPICSDFQLINPCGITDRPVTSLEREVADASRVAGLEALRIEAARQFGWSSVSRFWRSRALTLCARRRRCRDAPEFPRRRHAAPGSARSRAAAQSATDRRRAESRAPAHGCSARFIIRQELGRERRAVPHSRRERSMPTDVVMPQMGESIFEGTITKWLKKPGEPSKKTSRSSKSPPTRWTPRFLRPWPACSPRSRCPKARPSRSIRWSR